MKEMQDVKKRNRNKPEIAEIDCAFQSLPHRFENVKLLGSNKKGVAMKIIRRSCWAAECSNKSRARLSYPESLLRTVVRHQPKEKISITEPRPGDVASVFVMFRHPRRSTLFPYTTHFRLTHSS